MFVGATTIRICDADGWASHLLVAKDAITICDAEGWASHLLVAKDDNNNLRCGWLGIASPCCIGRQNGESVNNRLAVFNKKVKIKII